jgi:hypothetical protein
MVSDKPGAIQNAIPANIGVEPDRQRGPTLERFVVCWPVPGPVGRRCGSAHENQLPRWIHEINPSRDLCNRAIPRPRPRRNEDAFCHTVGPTANGTELRPPSCEASSPHRRAQSLYGARHTRHGSCVISPSCGREDSTSSRLV